MLISFWFAIHKQFLLEAQIIFKLDKIIGVIIKNLRKNGKPLLKLKKKLESNQGKFKIKNLEDEDDEESEEDPENSELEK